MTPTSLWNHDLPTAAFIGVIAAIAYLISYARHRSGPFTVIDALIVTAIMAIVTALASPLVNSASENARGTVLRQNLYALRSQIERYKIEHGGQAPLLFNGRMPQLTEATNAEGFPGASGNAYPFGPYLPDGIPVNPFTGINTIRPVENFPPSAATGGGWLYHQKTGRIAADFGPFVNE